MSGPIWIQLFDTHMLFLNEFFKKVDIEKKNKQMTKKNEKFPREQIVRVGSGGSFV